MQKVLEKDRHRDIDLKLGKEESEDGFTIMHIAAKEENSEMLALFATRFGPGIPDKKKRMPFDVAVLECRMGASLGSLRAEGRLSCSLALPPSSCSLPLALLLGLSFLLSVFLSFFLSLPLFLSSSLPLFLSSSLNPPPPTHTNNACVPLISRTTMIVLARLNRYLGRYTIVPGPPAHVSDYSTVVYALDALNDDKAVAIKIGDDEQSFKSLINVQKIIRSYLDKCSRAKRSESLHREVDLRSVMVPMESYVDINAMTILEYNEHGSPMENVAMNEAETEVENLSYEHKDLLRGGYAVVMPRAKITLAQSFESELCE